MERTAPAYSLGDHPLDVQNKGLLQIQSVHPGYEATAASKARGETKREQKQAYKAAMKALQDDYYENVASHCGLTRLGPRRQRLTRKEWAERRRQAKSLATARASLMADLEKAKAQAKQVIDDRIAKTQAEAQARVNDVMMQMHQRIEALKQKAGQRISEQQKVERPSWKVNLLLRRNCFDPLWLFSKNTGSGTARRSRQLKNSAPPSLLKAVQARRFSRDGCENGATSFFTHGMRLIG